jgi:hypothetical protein
MRRPSAFGRPGTATAVRAGTLHPLAERHTHIAPACRARFSHVDWAPSLAPPPPCCCSTGDMAIWQRRPITRELQPLVDYAAQDGRFLLDLLHAMRGGLTHPLVVEEARRRWVSSTVPTWRNSREMARNPFKGRRW